MSLNFRKKLFAVVAENPLDYVEDFCPDNELFCSLRGKADVLAFRERSWCMNYDGIPFPNKTCSDNVAVAEFTDYMEWWNSLPEQTRMRVMKSRMLGLEVEVVDPYEPEDPIGNKPRGFRFAEGMWKIYNEIPIRQSRRFKHYGDSLAEVQRHVFNSPRTVFIGAYVWMNEGTFLKRKLIGFVELICGEETGMFTQILSSVHMRHFMPNNALIAKTVEVCSNRHLNWLIYARMGNHPSLDEFKRNNGFQKVNIKRYFIPLSRKGKVLLMLGLQRDLKDSVPNFLKPLGFRVYNFVSRMKVKQ